MVRFGDHHYTIACVGLRLSSAVDPTVCSLRVEEVHRFDLGHSYAFGFSPYVQFASGPKAHPPTHRWGLHSHLCRG